MTIFCYFKGLLLSVSGLLLLSQLVCTFNLDLNSVVTHHGQEGSMFGFTVLQHTDRGQQMLLVGAPEAQTTQPNVNKGGSVFKCSISQQDVCEEIVFDSKGPNTGWNPQTRNMEPYDDKSGQWFGASMTSSGPDGIVAVCAPRYVYFSPNFAKREPVGTCYVAEDSFSKFSERSPCRSGAGSSGYHQQGSCQSGFSVSVSKDASRLFMGAPGTWYWQGQLHSLSTKEPEDAYATVESPPINDDSYLGYATAVGEFSGDKMEDIAVGMPRGYNLTGAVIIFDQKLKNLLNISGDQMGSYFGYAIAVADINGDKLDDLIVGAPLYTNFSSNDLSFEKGRVYVYYQKASRLFSSPAVIDGEHDRGRLGMSVASAGDLNLDGFHDLAVGAPYAGEDGNGVVSIYMGSRSGIITKPTQTILAREINEQLSTFGFSLSGGVDIDKNQYPDLVVGAYKSDRAVVLKSRPVVLVTAHLDMPTTINLEHKGTCALQNGTVVSCFVLNTFIKYTGINVPENLAIQVETILDSGSETPRAFFRTQEGQSRLNTTFELAKNQQRNSSVYVYLPNSFRDKLSPIKLESKYRLLDSNYAAQSRSRRDIRPVLDQLNSTSVAKSIRIGNKCGSDNICYPKLRLTARESSGIREYVLGKSEQLTVDVEINNEGEDSFETMFFLDLPSGIEYVKMQAPPNQPNVAVTCTRRGNANENVVMCDVANPLPAGAEAKFKIFLSPVAAKMTTEILNFTAMVNSSNEGRPGGDRERKVEFRLPVFAEAQLSVTGSSTPDQVRYCIDCSAPSTYTDEKQIGPEVKHTYQVYNKGPSTMEKGQIRIVWPSQTRNRMHLLYILEDPFVVGNVKCSKLSTNVAGVAIDFNSTLGYVSQDERKRLQKAQAMTSSGSARNQRDFNGNDDRNQNNYSDRRYRSTMDEIRSEWTDPQKACGASDCTFITCDIGRLMEREHVLITVRSRLWEESLRKLQFSDIRISSKALVQVQALSYGIKPRSYQYASNIVTTDVVPSDPSQVIPAVAWWIWLIGVLIGLLLLVLLLLCCWKLGFFRRKLPPTAAAAGGTAVATNGSSAPRRAPATSNGRGVNGNGNGAASNTPYYAYRYDYADNKYYPERAAGDAYL